MMMALGMLVFGGCVYCFDKHVAWWNGDRRNAAGYFADNFSKILREARKGHNKLAKRPAGNRSSVL
jgi:hypothetical protein